MLSLGAARAWAQQPTGHRILGTVGVNAGTEAPEGLYLADQFIFYGSRQLMDQSGNPLPNVNLRLDAVSNVVGVAGTYQLPRIHTYLTMAFSAPLSRVTASTDDPRAELDRFGLGDLYLQPIKLGWKVPHADIVTSYALYIPTGTFEPGTHGTVSESQYVQEFSLGGTVYFDRRRTWQFSALASYELNEPKQGIDIIRGDEVQVQGGAGKRLLRWLALGLDGYMLYQVRDDRGSAVPPILVGLRERTYGLGGELDLDIPSATAHLTFRYAHDLGAEARPQGQIFTFNVTFAPLERLARRRRGDRAR